MTQVRPLSLKERIAEAQSESDIDSLLREGRDYQHASNRTINDWNRTASRRREELLNEGKGQ